MMAQSQFNGGPDNTFGSIGGNDFVVDVFIRTTTDYTGISNYNSRSWNSNVDVVITAGNRIRPYDEDVALFQMIQGWNDFSNQERLTQMLEELERFEGPKDCNATLGLVDFFRDVLGEIANFNEGRRDLNAGNLEVEYAAALVTSDGNLSFFDEGYFTDNLSYQAGLPIPVAEQSSVVSIIHNHPIQGDIKDSINKENRYPSNDDWNGADLLIANGADPNILSLTIIDPFGETRVFPYADKSI